MVYVDDFKMAGPDDGRTEKAWESIYKAIDMDEATDLGICLGVGHTIKEIKDKPGKALRRKIEYDMSGFLQQCCDVNK